MFKRGLLSFCLFLLFFIPEHSHAELLVHEDFENGTFQSFWTLPLFDGRHYQPNTGATRFSHSVVQNGSRSLHYHVLRGTDERQPVTLYKDIVDGTDEYYLEWYEYFESGYPFVSGQKIMRISYSPTSGSRSGGVESEIAIRDNGKNIQLRWFRFGNIAENYINTNRAVPLNRWVKFAVWGKLNTPGQRNGFLKAWLDDELIANLGQEEMRTSNITWNTMSLGMNYSNRGVGLSRNGSRYIDNVKWYSTKPNTVSPPPPPRERKIVPLQVKRVTSSSQYYYYSANRLIDGRDTPPWIGPGGRRPWYLTFDLGSAHYLSTVEIDWYFLYGASKFRVETSLDGVNYRRFATSSASGSEEYPYVKPSKTDLGLERARYMRIVIDEEILFFPAISEVRITGSP